MALKVTQLGKDVHAAIADLTSAVTLSPRSVKALKHRAQAYVRLGRLDLALQDLERAVEASNEGGERRALERERDEVRGRIAQEEREREREEEGRRWREKQVKRKVRAGSYRRATRPPLDPGTAGPGARECILRPSPTDQLEPVGPLQDPRHRPQRVDC